MHLRFSVSYCNGRVLYGRLISVHEASDEDLQRVLAESREAGPELGPKRLGPARGVSTEEEDNGTSQGYDYEDISTLETGLNSYSDSGKIFDSNTILASFLNTRCQCQSASQSKN